jgi:transposase InsO family protein
VSPATVARYLTRAGLVTPTPKKRPRSSYIRFAADLPNECWQSDVTHYRLADGTGAEILTWLDDHARYALSVTAHRRVTGADRGRHVRRHRSSARHPRVHVDR